MPTHAQNLQKSFQVPTHREREIKNALRTNLKIDNMNRKIIITRRKYDHTTQHIHNGGESAINKLIMNKLTDITIMNRSAKNTATVHMRDRWA